MDISFPISPADIETRCTELGHKLGWRFLTSPFASIDSATTALVTINPGGNQFEPPRWEVTSGSAYFDERWKISDEPGGARLQIQVQRLFSVMGLKPTQVFSGYLVPFRSPTWSELNQKRDSIIFGRSLWGAVFDRRRFETVIVFGKDITGPTIAGLLGATQTHRLHAEWGNQTIDVYQILPKGRLIVLPHLSRFSLFGRPKSELAFLQALQT